MATTPVRILIVDDDVDTARMMKVLLKQEGFEVALAFDGNEAIATARVLKPEVVLLDLTLPGMSGSEVAARLKDVPALASCLLVAVSGEDAEMVGLSFDRYFQKPVDPEALLKLLGEFAAAHK
jgi:DNA-binding response OmpR family regulator